jgi:hypothetical protein
MPLRKPSEYEAMHSLSLVKLIVNVNRVFLCDKRVSYLGVRVRRFERTAAAYVTMGRRQS